MRTEYRTETWTGKRPNGQPCVVTRRTEITINPNSRGSNKIEKQEIFVDGEEVDWLEKGKYKTLTGFNDEIITSDDPNAP